MTFEIAWSNLMSHGIVPPDLESLERLCHGFYLAGKMEQIDDQITSIDRIQKALKP
jgi:hypothetical protein